MHRPSALPLLANLLTLCVVASIIAAPMTARAQEGDSDGAPGADAAPVSSPPLVPIPSGCVEPVRPDVVFVGTLVDRDFRTGRFRIEQVRAGDIAPYDANGLIDVRYGFDVDYLELGAEYLVAAEQDQVLGVLASKIREQAPRFGGDEVIGITESDVECPVFEDSIRTLLPDGSSVESGILAPFVEERTRIAAAFLVPLGIAFGVIFILATLRLSLSGLARGVGTVARRHR